MVESKNSLYYRGALKLDQSSLGFFKKPSKPFLRWAGGKNWITNRLSKAFNSLEFNHYHEPFLGGGSIFFGLPHRKRSFLSDINASLIETYNCLKDGPEEVIRNLQNYSNDRESYYKIRQESYSNAYARAAQFIYLNQTSFNGIYRVNFKGDYNVPYGYRTKNFLDEDTLLAASIALQDATIEVSDFEETKFSVANEDLVFIDPPYTVSHNENGFIKYNKSLFSLEDQKRLANYIKYIKSIGAHYILTNAAHSSIREIFSDCEHVIEIERNSRVGGKRAKRGMVAELLFTDLEISL